MPAPAAPRQVKITFNSEPPGAAVLRRDTGAVLGTTPFDQDLPRGTDPIELVFRKSGYEDNTRVLVPDTSAVLTTALVAQKPAPPPAVAAPARPPPRGRQAAHARPAAPKEKKDKRIIPDEDGVLAPSF